MYQMTYLHMLYLVENVESSQLDFNILEFVHRRSQWEWHGNHLTSYTKDLGGSGIWGSFNKLHQRSLWE